MHLRHEIMWNANLMQQGNLIDVFSALHVSGAYAHHREHYILSCSIWFSALSNPTITLNTHKLRRDLITNTHNPQHLKPPPWTHATHTPPTTRWAQTSSPHTNRPVQYFIDCIDKHLYNTAYSHYIHTSYSHSLQCRKQYAASQLLMLLMMSICARNM